MADKWEQYKLPTEDTTDKWAQYKLPTEPAVSASAPSKEAPGWFQPGSTSEALVRGMSQGATLGFGDEAQAAMRAFLDSNKQPGESYADAYRRLRDDERGANSQAQAANPGTYLAGTVAGSLPSTALAPASGVVKGLGFNAIQGALAGAGNSDANTLGGVAADAGVAGATTAALGGVGQAAGALLNKGAQVANKVAGGARDRLFNTASEAGDKMAAPINEWQKKFGWSMDEVLKPAYKDKILPSVATTAKDVGKSTVQNFKDQFTKMDPADWALGAIVGATHGPGLGAAAVVGKKMLVGATAKAINDNKDKILNNAAAVTAVAEKFTPVVKQAMQKGMPFAAINNVLQQQSPEYREMLRAQDKLKDGEDTDQ